MMKSTNINNPVVRTAMAENATAIAEAREKFAGSRIRGEKSLDQLIEHTLNQYAPEISGDQPMVAGWRKSPWAHMDPVAVFETVILPEGRMTVPFRLTAEKEGFPGNWEILRLIPVIDRSHPDADLVSRWQWYGSSTHGREVRVVWSRKSEKGFDLSRTNWPRETPVNYATLRRIVDELGKPVDCCGNFKEVPGGAIERVLADSQR